MILGVKVKKWLRVRESFKSETGDEIKEGTLLRINDKGPNHIWCLDPECNSYAIDRKEMWYLELVDLS